MENFVKDPLRMDFSQIQQRWPQMEVLYRDQMSSTNDFAMQVARSQVESELVLVITNEQTTGRGRRGNAWSSRKGNDLTFSLMHRPEGTLQSWYRLALVAASAVLGTLREEGMEAEVKWPNDLWIQGKKCAGILVETTGEWAVVGIGINVNGGLEKEADAGRTTLESEKRNRLVREELLEQILARYFSLMSEGSFAEAIAKVAPFFALSGQEISYRVGKEKHSAKVQGVGPHGGLLLESGEEVLHAHEVRLQEDTASQDVAEA